MANSADPVQLASSDLDLHCMQMLSISGFSRTWVKLWAAGLEKLKIANQSSHFRPHLRSLPSFLAGFKEFAEQRFSLTIVKEFPYCNFHM